MLLKEEEDFYSFGISHSLLIQEKISFTNDTNGIILLYIQFINFINCKLQFVTLVNNYLD